MKKLLFLMFCLFFAACAEKHSFVLQDATVVDQGTGLVWTKNANPAGKPLELRSEDNVDAFLQKLNAENFAGYADWRVPTRDEMTSLIAFAKSKGYDRDKYDTWPYQQLRQLGFIDVRDYDYWTSTRNTAQELYVADLGSGEVQPKPDSKFYYLWPVRGGR